jgi:hypothetical protein
METNSNLAAWLIHQAMKPWVEMKRLNIKYFERKEDKNQCIKFYWSMELTNTP